MGFSARARRCLAQEITHWAASRHSGFGSTLTLMSRSVSSWGTSGDQERSYYLQLLFTSLCSLTCYHPFRSSSKTTNIIISLTISVNKYPTLSSRGSFGLGFLFVCVFIYYLPERVWCVVALCRQDLRGSRCPVEVANRPQQGPSAHWITPVLWSGQLPHQVFACINWCKDIL